MANTSVIRINNSEYRPGYIEHITIPASGLFVINKPGDFVHVLKSTQNITIESDISPAKPFLSGQGETYPYGNAYKSLTVYGTSGTVCDIFCGFGRFNDNRVQVQELDKTIRGGNVSTIAGLATIALPAFVTATQKRIAVIISNDDVINKLNYTDANGLLSGSVPAGTSIKIDTVDAFNIVNPNAGIIPMKYCEVIYKL